MEEQRVFEGRALSKEKKVAGLCFICHVVLRVFRRVEQCLMDLVNVGARCSEIGGEEQSRADP